MSSQGATSPHLPKCCGRELHGPSLYKDQGKMSDVRRTTGGIPRHQPNATMRGVFPRSPKGSGTLAYFKRSMAMYSTKTRTKPRNTEKPGTTTRTLLTYFEKPGTKRRDAESNVPRQRKSHKVRWNTQLKEVPSVGLYTRSNKCENAPKHIHWGLRPVCEAHLAMKRTR